MGRSLRYGVFHVLLVLAVASLARCALLEMSRILWTKAVSGGLAKVGKLDPLRVPIIKVDQSESETNYRMILRNLEIVGLNESMLESVHIARGELNSNLSELETGYVSYSDLRNVDSIKYRFHTTMREPSVRSENLDAVFSPANRAADIRPSSRYQADYLGRLQQDQYRSRMFERSQQYDQTSFRPYAIPSDGSYRGNSKVPSTFERNPFGNLEGLKRTADVQPVYAQTAKNVETYRGSAQHGEDLADCIDAQGLPFGGYQESSRQYRHRQGADSRHYGERFEDVEVSASETIGTRLRNPSGTKVPASYYREQSPRSYFATSGSIESPKDGIKKQSGYIDIVYADDRVNGSTKHFGNLGIDPREKGKVYSIKDIMKDLQASTKYIIYNFTDGEALTKRNDAVKIALETKKLKDLSRYARGYQEQQGYFEEGMQLIYHYGGINAKNGSAFQNINVNDTKRIKRAHPEGETEDDVMHVILRLRVPLLRVKSQYTLMGKVGREMLHGNGLLVGNFTDLVADFALELKKINEELMIVRATRAKLSTRDKKIVLQGMNEKGPVQAILTHSLMAAEAIAAMLADDLATKGLSEKTAEAVIYRMYKDIPVK